MNAEPTLSVVFFRTNTDREPVRNWLRGLTEAKKTIGKDIKTVQFGWPNNIPGGVATRLRNVQKLWEVRSNVGRQEFRVFFAVKKSEMVLLHGFLKNRPDVTTEIRLAQNRLRQWESGSV